MNGTTTWIIGLLITLTLGAFAYTTNIDFKTEARIEKMEKRVTDRLERVEEKLDRLIERLVR